MKGSNFKTYNLSKTSIFMTGQRKLILHYLQMSTDRDGSRTKHPGTKHPMPFFYTPDKTSHKDLPPRTKHPTLFLSPWT